MKGMLKLAHAPIVEAVVDIDCDMPPGFDLANLEQPSRDRFRDRYPKFREQFVQKHTIEAQGKAPPKMPVRHGIQSFHFLQEDEKQLVQVRAQGFSFNRLAPYGSLDDYLPEIERCWTVFRELTQPIQVRVVRLRYINRILIPIAGDTARLADYFEVSSQLPPESGLKFLGFFQQHLAREDATGHEAMIVLTSQAVEQDKLPVI